MLQIIGFLGCAYMIVKALEMTARPDFRNENGFLNGSAVLAIAIAWVAAAVFTIWLLIAGAQVSGAISAGADSATMSQREIDCINGAKGSDEILACEQSQ
jgi:hypothetical protein